MMVHLVIDKKTNKPIGLEKFNDNLWYCMIFPSPNWGMGRLKISKPVNYFILT